jgi:hypothetical protein
MWLAALLSGQVASAALIGVVFGFTRAAVVVTTAGIDTPSDLRSFHRRLVAFRRLKFRSESIPMA